MHFVQNNRILKSIFSFLPPTPLQNQLFHCEKKNLLTFLVQDLLNHCITLYELCSNCTVLTPVFSHFLVFLLSRYCRVLYHRGTMGHSGVHNLSVHENVRHPRLHTISYFHKIHLLSEFTRFKFRVSSEVFPGQQGQFSGVFLIPKVEFLRIRQDKIYRIRISFLTNSHFKTESQFFFHFQKLSQQFLITPF